MYNPDPSQYPPGGFVPGYGGTPPPSTGTPPVVILFKIYAGLVALIYLCAMGVGIFMLVAGASVQGLEELQGDMSPIVVGVIGAVMGLVVSVAYSIGVFLPRRPWGWVYGIVLIAFGMVLFGMMSLCCMPLTIPLLIFWLKPEVKAYFGRF